MKSKHTRKHQENTENAGEEGINGKNDMPETENASITECTANAEQTEEKILTEEEILKVKFSGLEKQLEEANDKYLRLYSEFENYKKRMVKEKIDTIRCANEDLICMLLQLLDDFERANKSTEETNDIKPIKEGIDIIYNKFKNTLTQRGLKEIEIKDNEFNTDFHEAVCNVPATDENMKGKIVEIIEKGYTLNGKIIRYAKVVVAI
ncbi:MAG: nucleotide exchange factor GrpE [Bacteroidales bacterium]|nr:nucleotide exchange factor GrpE [Bacteroidales bacterium]